DLVTDLLAGIGQRFQILERLATIVEHGGLCPHRFHAAFDLFAGDGGVIDDEHMLRARRQRHFLIDNPGGDLLDWRGNLRQHLLDINDFDQFAVDLGHRRQIVVAAGAFGWRMDILPIHVDDALHGAHQKALRRRVVLGNDDEAVLDVADAALADGEAAVQHGHSPAATVGDPTYRPFAFRQYRQGRTSQYFAHLEHVDAIHLRPVQLEQQQLQSVLADQLRALVDGV